MSHVPCINTGYHTHESFMSPRIRCIRPLRKHVHLRFVPSRTHSAQFSVICLITHIIILSRGFKQLVVFSLLSNLFGVVYECVMWHAWKSRATHTETKRWARKKYAMPKPPEGSLRLTHPPPPLFEKTRFWDFGAKIQMYVTKYVAPKFNYLTPDWKKMKIPNTPNLPLCTRKPPGTASMTPTHPRIARTPPHWC